MLGQAYFRRNGKSMGSTTTCYFSTISIQKVCSLLLMFVVQMKQLPRKNLTVPLFSGAITFFAGQLPHFLVTVMLKIDDLLLHGLYY